MPVRLSNVRRTWKRKRLPWPTRFFIEIVSTKSSKRDIKGKFEIYQENGVGEYWIVNPNDEIVNVFVLSKEGKFQLTGMYAGDDKIPVNIFNGDFAIDLTEVFV